MYKRQALIDDSVYRLLLEKFRLGLFENPYVDAEAAEKRVGNAGFQALANEAHRKSVVLLRNEAARLPLRPGLKVYFETFYPQGGQASPHVVYGAKSPAGLTFVATPEQADVVLLWLVPGGRSLFGSNGQPLRVSLSQNGIDVGYVRQLISKKPTVLAINYTNPWVIDEIYDDARKGNVQAMLATFGTTPEALLDVVAGRFHPSGKMPFTTPVSEQAVSRNREDVPGYLEGPAYGLFRYDEGLSYPKR